MKSVKKRKWSERCAEKRQNETGRVEALKAAAAAVQLQQWAPPEVVRYSWRPSVRKGTDPIYTSVRVLA